MKHSIKGQWDLSNPSVPDLFDLRAKTPPLRLRPQMDGYIQQGVLMTRFAKEKHIQSEWALLQPPLFDEWWLTHCTHYGFHGDWPKTLKCNISASNKARDMRFSVFAFKIRALYGPIRWIHSKIMAKYGQTHTHLTHPLCNTHFVPSVQSQYWQHILLACPLVHLPGIIPKYAKSPNYLQIVRF